MGIRIILTTGGTGGHIFPALAVAEQLRREGAELLFVGSQYGSEAKLAKQAGLEFRGLPVREAIVESGKNAVGHPGTRRLLVMGGSQGAKAVNSVILASLERLTKAGIEIRHQTGSFDLERVLAGYRAHGVDASGVTPFIEDVAAAYQWADLVLCRAGATSVAELAVAGKPAVLVPFPYATHDHQTYNAQVMVDQGAALLVAEKDLPHLDAGGMLINLLLDPGTLRTMSQMAHTCARPDAASKVAQGVLALCRQS